MSAGLRDVINREDRLALERWLRMLPEELIQRQPQLLMIKAWAFQFSWRLDLQVQVIRQIEDLLVAEEGTSLPADELQLLHAQIFLLKAQQAYLTNQPNVSIELCYQALELLPLSWTFGHDAINPDSMKIVVSEFDYSQTQVVYNENGVKVTSFPVVHALSGAVGYRLDFAGLSFGFSGDTRACKPLVRACEGVDLLIHECFPPAAALAAASGLSIERATIALNAAHTSPTAAGKVFGLVKPRVAGLYHTLLSPQVIQMVFSELSSVYNGHEVQTQDLMVINIKEGSNGRLSGKSI